MYYNNITKYDYLYICYMYNTDRVFIKLHIIRCVWDLVTDHNMFVNDLKWCSLIIHIHHNIFYIICYTYFVCVLFLSEIYVRIRTLIAFIMYISTCTTIYKYMDGVMGK